MDKKKKGRPCFYCCRLNHGHSSTKTAVFAIYFLSRSLFSRVWQVEILPSLASGWGGGGVIYRQQKGNLLVPHEREIFDHIVINDFRAKQGSLEVYQAAVNSNLTHLP
jgi:hypothetical protein